LIIKNLNTNGLSYADAISLNKTMRFTNTAGVIIISNPNYPIITMTDFIKKSSLSVELGEITSD
jgi:hypothetical protein